MSYVISISVCLAYGLLCLWMFKRSRIEIARRQLAYERRVMYEARQQALATMARMVPVFALTAQAARRAAKTMQQFHESWKVFEERGGFGK